MPTTNEAVIARLREFGFRATSPRLAAYRAVCDIGGHPDVELTTEHVRDQLGAVSVQAVYDALRTLTTVGLLRRIEPAGSPARYEARTGDNHHHVVCRLCGAIQDIDCVTGSAPCLTSSDTQFLVDEAEVTFWGVCPGCRATA